MIWIYGTRNDSFTPHWTGHVDQIISRFSEKDLLIFFNVFFRISAEVHDLQLQQAPLGGRPCPEAAQSHVPYGTLNARLVQKWRNGFRTSHLHPSVFWFLHNMATAQAKLRGNIEQALRLLGILSVSSAFQNRKQKNCLRQRNIWKQCSRTCNALRRDDLQSFVVEELQAHLVKSPTFENHKSRTRNQHPNHMLKCIYMASLGAPPQWVGSLADRGLVHGVRAGHFFIKATGFWLACLCLFEILFLWISDVVVLVCNHRTVVTGLTLMHYGTSRTLLWRHSRDCQQQMVPCWRWCFGDTRRCFVNRITGHSTGGGSEAGSIRSKMFGRASGSFWHSLWKR